MSATLLPILLFGGMLIFAPVSYFLINKFEFKIFKFWTWTLLLAFVAISVSIIFLLINQYIGAILTAAIMSTYISFSYISWKRKKSDPFLKGN